MKPKLLTAKSSALIEPLRVTYSLITHSFAAAAETIRFTLIEAQVPRPKLVPIRARRR